MYEESPAWARALLASNREGAEKAQVISVSYDDENYLATCGYALHSSTPYRLWWLFFFGPRTLRTIAA